MTPKTKQIVLSVSAMATIVGTLAQVAQQDDATITLHDRDTTAGSDERLALDAHMDGIRTPFTGVAAEAAYRRHMGMVVDKLDIDRDSMERSWIHLTTFDNLGSQFGSTGTGVGAARRGAVLGHQSDSTMVDGVDYSGYSYGANLCYTNCHSACHGSRGWR